MEPCAEASTSDREHWRLAQSELCYQLPQLSHHGNGAVLKGQGGAVRHVEPPAEPEPTLPWELLEDWCEDHRKAYTQRNGKAGESWWIHRRRMGTGAGNSLWWSPGGAFAPSGLLGGEEWSNKLLLAPY